MRITFTIFLFFTVLNAYSQSGSDKWYFGRYAGLEFPDDYSELPTSINGGLLNTSEGCAVATDLCGNVLFYTDGISVWDNTHNLITVGLSGNSTTTTSAVIAQKPGDPNTFYIFTAQAQCAENGLSVSTIEYENTELKITELNNNIARSSAEKIDIISHANGIDYWAVTMTCAGEIKSFLVDSSGINTEPVRSQTGFDFVNNFNSIGQMKSNVDGNLIAAGIYDNDRLVVYEFDSESGRVDLKYNMLHRDFRNIYGIEFSPNGRYLYVGTTYNDFHKIPSAIWQLDLNYANQRDILENKVLLYSSFTRQVGQIELARDMRIYVSIYDTNKLSVIYEPDNSGLNSDFRLDLIDLGFNGTRLGLPHQPKMILPRENYSELLINVCSGEDLVIIPPYFEDAQYFWSINGNDIEGDTITLEEVSNNKYFSNLLEIVHPCFTRLIEYKLAVSELPNPEIQGSNTLCEGTTTTLSIDDDIFNFYQVLWSDGSSEQEMVVDEPGEYWVRISNPYCENFDTVRVDYINSEFEITGDTVLCGKDNTTLTVVTPDNSYSFNWSTGEVTRAINVSESGNYWVFVYKDGNCLGKSEISVVENDVPKPNLNIDSETTICIGEALEVELLNFEEYIFIEWSDRFTEPKREISQAGTYKIYLYGNSDCFDSTLFTINYSEDIEVEISGNKRVCLGKTITLSIDVDPEDYRILWSNGSRADRIPVSQPGTYSVVVTSDIGCTYTDTVEVEFFSNVNLESNYSGLNEICSGDTLFFEVIEPNPDFEYLWSDDYVGSSRPIFASGRYVIYAINGECQDSVMLDLVVYTLPNLEIYSETTEFSCELDSLHLSVLNPLSNLNYFWSNGAVGSSIYVHLPGKYTVYSTNQFGCIDSASITINSAENLLTPEIVGKNMICENESIVLRVSDNFDSYLWSTGETTQAITVTQAGTYSVTVENENSCNGFDSFLVESYSTEIDFVNVVNFDEICSSEITSYILEISNPNSYELIISDLNTIFRDNFIIQNLPITIPAESTIDLELIFAPDLPIDYSNIAELVFESPCDTNITLEINASSYNEIEISISEIVGMPGEIKCADIDYITLCGKQIPDEIDYELDIQYDNSHFYPESTNGIITKDRPNRSILIESTIERIGNQGKLNEICGLILLHSNFKSEIIITDSKFGNYNFKAKFIPGTIETSEFCADDIRSVYFTDRTFVQVNSIKEELTVATKETGIFVIKIYDYAAREIFTSIFENNSQVYNYHNIDLNYDFPNGLYFIKVSNNQNIYSDKFIINK